MLDVAGVEARNGSDPIAPLLRVLVLTGATINCIAILKAVEQATALCANHELCHQTMHYIATLKAPIKLGSGLSRQPARAALT
jgi:hypothetical protein